MSIRRINSWFGMIVLAMIAVNSAASFACAQYDLLGAIKQNDLERVKELFANGQASVNRVFGQSPLKLAVAEGNLEICRYLIEEQHANVDEHGSGYPVIKYALPHPEIVKLLIDHHVDLTIEVDWYGGASGPLVIGFDSTPLHHAANESSPETVKLLIDSGIDIFARADNRMEEDREPEQTALDVAAFYGKAENAKAIVTHPKFLEADAELRQAVLDQALRSGSFSSGLAREADRPALLNVLLDAGANPNAQDENGDTAIKIVASAIDPVTEFFPERAAYNAEYQALIDILLSHGGQLDLYSAVALGEGDTVAELIRAKPPEINVRASDGLPALSFAAWANDLEIVKLLVQAGADVNVRNHSRDYRGCLEGTPLHEAVHLKSPAVAKVLIAAGADVDAKMEDDATPLHIAAGMKHLETARLLLEKGADVNAKDDEGRTPMDWWRISTDEMQKLLIKHGGKQR